MSFFDDKKVLEQKTVTNTNTDTTSGSQVLQQEFGPADGSRIAEEQKLGERTISLSTKAQQQVTQIHGELESEENDKLKEQEQGEVWTANEVLKLGEIQLALIISVNCKQKIVHVELDI